MYGARHKVPDAIFALIKLTDPKTMTVKEPVFSLASSAWALWLFGKRGKFNFGLGLIRFHAKQFAARFPNVEKCNGRARDWEGILKRKSYLMGRKDAQAIVAHLNS